MRGSPTRFALVAALIAAGSAASPDALADGAVGGEINDEAGRNADEHFRRGKAFVKDGKLEEARRAYLEGWNLKRGYDIAGNLGNVELALGDARSAAEHLSFCVRNYPATGSARQLESIKERLAIARRRVAAVRVKVSVDGAEVLVDDRPIGRSPLSDEVFVDPGQHKFKARLTGYEVAWVTRDTIAGGTSEVPLVLSPLQGPVVVIAPAKAVLPQVAPQPAPPRRSTAPLFIGIGTVIAGVGVGIPALAVSRASGDGAAELRDQIKKNPLIGDEASACGPKMLPQLAGACTQLARLDRLEVTFRIVGIVGLATAGAAALGTAAYGVVLSRSPAKASVRAGLVLAPGVVGAGVSGRFQ